MVVCICESGRSRSSSPRRAIALVSSTTSVNSWPGSVSTIGSVELVAAELLEAVATHNKVTLMMIAMKVSLHIDESITFLSNGLDVRWFLYITLLLVEVVVRPVPLKKIPMRTLFDDTPTFEHQDLIKLIHAEKLVSNE